MPDAAHAMAELRLARLRRLGSPSSSKTEKKLGWHVYENTMTEMLLIADELGGPRSYVLPGAKMRS